MGGAMARLGRPEETIRHAAEVVRANDDPSTRNYWPMRAANARVEWAIGLAGLGDEDEAAAVASRALEPQWWRSDTAQRMRVLLAKMRDSRLRAQLADRMHESEAAARALAERSG